MALHLGGSNDLSNAQCLCTRCHGAKTLGEERARLGRVRDERERAVLRARAFLRSLVTMQLPKLVAMWVCVSMLMLTFTFAGSIFRMKISRFVAGNTKS